MTAQELLRDDEHVREAFAAWTAGRHKGPLERLTLTKSIWGAFVRSAHGLALTNAGIDLTGATIGTEAPVPVPVPRVQPRRMCGLMQCAVQALCASCGHCTAHCTCEASQPLQPLTVPASIPAPIPTPIQSLPAQPVSPLIALIADGLRDYWTLALGQPPRTRKAQTKVDLLKLSISKDALIERGTLHGLLTDPQATLLPVERGAADNVRLALSYRLKDLRNFAQGGAQCKVLAVPTRGSKGLDIWIHVQRRSTEAVEYSSEPVCQIRGSGAGEPVTVAVSDHSYPDLLQAIGTSTSLKEFGARHYFESDIRKLAQGLLEASCLPLWPGILLALTPEASHAIQGVRRLLEALDAGQGTVSLLSLDHTPANRQALAMELAEGFGEQLAKLTEQLGYEAPMVEKIQAKYDALASKIALAESVLGVESKYPMAEARGFQEPCGLPREERVDPRTTRTTYLRPHFSGQEVLS